MPMPTKTIPQPELLSATSHYVTLTRDGELSKEEVYLTFATKWQGKDVLVKMTCDRYRHSSGMSEWRVYASEARSKTDEPHGYGAHVSDLAKSRLSAACKPHALRWVDNFNGEYVVSETAAYFHAIKRVAGDLKTYSDTPGDEVRTLIGATLGKLSREQADALLNMADAFDAFSKAYNAKVD